MLRIILSRSDCDRIGFHDPITFDPSILMIDELEYLQDEYGIDPGSLVDYQKAWIASRSEGLASLDSDGQRMAIRGEKAIVWMALARAGHRIDIGTLTFDKATIRFEFPQTASQGKEESSIPNEESPIDAPE